MSDCEPAAAPSTAPNVRPTGMFSVYSLVIVGPVFVARSREKIIKRTYVDGAPDLVIEIVSPDSESRDWREKYLDYEKSGVREYWIIDPIENRCTFLRLEDGAFVPVPLRRGRLFQSQVLPGFWLDRRWLMAEPLPDEFACLQQVLTGPPATS